MSDWDDSDSDWSDNDSDDDNDEYYNGLIDGSKLSINLSGKTFFPIDLLCSALEDSSSCKTTDLNLSQCFLQDEKIIPISKSLVVNETITCLNLSDNYEIGQKGIEALAQLIRRNKTLTKVICLEAFRKEDTNLGPIFEALRKEENCSIVEIDLGVQYQDEKAAKTYTQQILELVKENHSIKKLSWSYYCADEQTQEIVERCLERNRIPNQSLLFYSRLWIDSNRIEL